jgi:hypothetical protein
MSPEDYLRALCARHRVPTDQGARFLPLVARALGSSEPVRDQLLALIEARLASIGRSSKEERHERVRLDREILVAVARVLHQWAPSDLMLELGDRLAPPSDDADSAA